MTKRNFIHRLLAGAGGVLSWQTFSNSARASEQIRSPYPCPYSVMIKMRTSSFDDLKARLEAPNSPWLDALKKGHGQPELKVLEFALLEQDTYKLQLSHKIARVPFQQFMHSYYSSHPEA